MPSGKVNIKTETCVLNVITDFNEEKQFLTIPHYLKVQSKSKKPKCFFSLSIITIFVLTILIFSTKSTIQTFIKEIRIKNIFSKEEYSEYLSISPNSKKLTWKNETIKYRQIKKEIHQYVTNPVIPQEKKEILQRRDNPKISLIIPVYNREKYLLPFYASIRNQSLKDIEIIFIDDKSEDNSVKLIEEFMKEDKRIVLVKNAENKRTFFSRNYGVQIAKGKYVLLIDPDDLIINNILEKIFYTAEEHNLDITQYYIMKGNFNIMDIPNLKYKDGIIFQPKIKEIFFYSKTRNLCDKLIKREVYLKSLEFMKDKFKNDRYEIHDDDAVFYGLVVTAKSYGFLESVGYFYNIKVPGSTTKTKFKISKINKIFKTLFTILDYYFEQSEDNRMEKVLVPYKFFYKKVYIYKGYIKYLNDGIDYAIEVMEKMVNCEHYTKNEKFFLEKFLKKVLKQKKMEKKTV